MKDSIALVAIYVHLASRITCVHGQRFALRLIHGQNPASPYSPMLNEHSVSLFG